MLGTVKSVGVGPTCAGALVSFPSGSSEGFEFTKIIEMNCLKIIPNYTNDVIKNNLTSFHIGQNVCVNQYGQSSVSQGSDTSNYPWSLHMHSCIIKKLGSDAKRALADYNLAKYQTLENDGYANSSHKKSPIVEGVIEDDAPIAVITSCVDQTDQEYIVELKYLVGKKSKDLKKKQLAAGQFKKGTCLILCPTAEQLANDYKDFPWDNYGAVGFVVDSIHTEKTVIKVKKQYPNGEYQNLIPINTKYFRKATLQTSTFGLPPTEHTAGSDLLALYKKYQDSQSGGAMWVTNDKVEFGGKCLHEIKNYWYPMMINCTYFSFLFPSFLFLKGTIYDPKIPVVDAFYVEEPPVVVIASRIIEDRKQKKEKTLWDMPSDTWLELAVYIHSFYKKFDKRKGKQTFSPTITGHIPTTKEGRDRIMPPRATKAIMRQFISSDLFLTDKEKNEVVIANLPGGSRSSTTRWKCRPDEPANGRYEYQEQQLQNYLMNRYVNNNWVCKHFAPPLPDAGCWGNYDNSTQGWCCWGCKIIFPLSLLLLALSISMIIAANSTDYILSFR
jgi:hypothetical protein